MDYEDLKRSFELVKSDSHDQRIAGIKRLMRQTGRGELLGNYSRDSEDLFGETVEQAYQGLFSITTALGDDGTDFLAMANCLMGSYRCTIEATTDTQQAESCEMMLFSLAGTFSAILDIVQKGSDAKPNN